MNYASLSTEKENPASLHLDRLTPLQIICLMNQEDRRILSAVSRARHSIERAIRLMTASWRLGGRIIFVGAGTSGRLGVIEAAECPPTFSTPPHRILAVMAGGRSAVFKSKEGAEDSAAESVHSLRRLKVCPRDIVIGIAASGVTPFVKAALGISRKRGAKTILLTCNPKIGSDMAHQVIALNTGAEVLSGSTRLKAGSACKMVLNMLTTGSMVQLGKVYGNRMVDLQPKSRKLVERGVRLVRDIGRVSEKEARRLLGRTRGQVKPAIVMARKNMSYTQALNALSRTRGYLRGVI